MTLLVYPAPPDSLISSTSTLSWWSSKHYAQQGSDGVSIARTRRRNSISSDPSTPAKDRLGHAAAVLQCRRKRARLLQINPSNCQEDHRQSPVRTTEPLQTSIHDNSMLVLETQFELPQPRVRAAAIADKGIGPVIDETPEDDSCPQEEAKEVAPPNALPTTSSHTDSEPSAESALSRTSSSGDRQSIGSKEIAEALTPLRPTNGFPSNTQQQHEQGLDLVVATASSRPYRPVPSVAARAPLPPVPSAWTRHAPPVSSKLRAEMHLSSATTSPARSSVGSSLAGQQDGQTAPENSRQPSPSKVALAMASRNSARPRLEPPPGPAAAPITRRPLRTFVKAVPSTVTGMEPQRFSLGSDGDTQQSLSAIGPIGPVVPLTKLSTAPNTTTLPQPPPFSKPAGDAVPMSVRFARVQPARTLHAPFMPPRHSVTSSTTEETMMAPPRRAPLKSTSVLVRNDAPTVHWQDLHESSNLVHAASYISPDTPDDTGRRNGGPGHRQNVRMHGSISASPASLGLETLQVAPTPQFRLARLTDLADMLQSPQRFLADGFGSPVDVLVVVVSIADLRSGWSEARHGRKPSKWAAADLDVADLTCPSFRITLRDECATEWVGSRPAALDDETPPDTHAPQLPLRPGDIIALSHLRLSRIAPSADGRTSASIKGSAVRPAAPAVATQLAIECRAGSRHEVRARVGKGEGRGVDADALPYPLDRRIAECDVPHRRLLDLYHVWRRLA